MTNKREGRAPAQELAVAVADKEERHRVKNARMIDRAKIYNAAVNADAFALFEVLLDVATTRANSLAAAPDEREEWRFIFGRVEVTFNSLKERRNNEASTSAI